ncbi:MAG: alanine racemase [Hyphomicrobiaceae bacterium]
MTATLTGGAEDAHALARPLWADVDLSAIPHNLALLRARAGRPVRILAPVKANAYGHGIVAVARHMAECGVDGLATANVDDAVAARRAGVELPILIYGAQLPGGNAYLLEHRLTPTVYDGEGVAAVAALARASGRTIPVHMKVDAGLGRLGVRLDEAAELARAILKTRGLELEGIYTHIPFSDGAGESWSRRRMAAFAGLVAAIEAEHGIRIPYAQGAASSVMARDFPDPLNTIAPGHLVFGLFPIGGGRAEDLGFRKALTAVRARIIHIGRRRKGDDLYGSPAGGIDAERTVGTILLGMDNGYRPAPAGRTATMLCGGVRCPVLGVSAEYSVIDLSGVASPGVGDVVTLVGQDGALAQSAEDVAEQLGAPSAAYWMVGLKSVPLRYHR